ncbi:MAG: hypothetical protein QOE31_3081, partial [Solirubrobacteraceae bacterium]|nr:hypothetical protein [Solirubrobacteraceae bacterium]
GSDRLAPSVATGDEIATVETTRGFLSRGISFATTIYGGDGEDQFAVYSNQAPLSLFGEAGNDTFIVRAFLLASTGDSASGLTTVDGGDGDDYVEYNVNAPVAIDGGEGVDTIVVIGTEGNDQFVISRDSVQGAGLNVSYVSSERVEIDGMEGNDHFYVLSTDARVITSIIGGLGSDTIDVGGDVTGLVQALSIEGVSGAVNHVVGSTDALYDAIRADGVQLAVAGASSGIVIVTPSGGSTTVFEDGGSAAIDSYTLRLAVAAPATATVAYLTVAATQPSSRALAAGARTIEVSVDGITWATSLVLTFDSSIAGSGDPHAWARTQTIYVRAIGDGAAEGESIAIVNHSLTSANATFDRRPIASVPVRVIDNDKAGVTVIQSGVDTLVVEGSVNDTYTLALTRAPAAGETVTITLVADVARLVLFAADPTQAGRFNAAARTVTFDTSNWSTPFVVGVAATGDVVPHDAAFVTIRHSTASSLPGSAYGGTFVADVDVDTRDDDVAGVLVRETDGYTLVATGQPDTYTIQLTRRPAFGTTVSIALVGDGRAILSSAVPTDGRFVPGTGGGPPSVVFGYGDWSTPFVVKVEANPAGPATGAAVLRFPAQRHTTAGIAGPLLVEGGKVKDRPLDIGIGLPTELGASLPELLIVVDETTQVDTLNVFDDGSLAGASATLGAISDAAAHALVGIYGRPVIASDFRLLSGMGMGSGLTLDFGTAAAPDPATFDGGVTYANVEVLNIALGRAADTLTIDSTHSGTTHVSGGDGADTILVKTISGPTTLATGAGDDLVIVRSDAGLVDEIAALLTIDAGSGSDTVIVDDGAEVDDNVGVLTGSLLTGLDMVAGPGLQTVQTITIRATGGTYVLHVVRADLDGVLRDHVTAPIAFDAGAQAVQAALSAILNPNNAAGSGRPHTDNVRVERFGDGVLQVTFQGEDAAHAIGWLDARGLTGGGVLLAATAAGIAYHGVELLALALGSGDDVLDVRGTSATTNVALGDGDDRAYVASQADADLQSAPEFLRGDLDAILGTLNLDAGRGANTLMISDEASGTGDGAVLIT